MTSMNKISFFYLMALQSNVEAIASSNMLKLTLLTFEGWLKFAF